MDGIFADVRPGARLDLTVEFITKRPLACDGATVCRLLVTDQAGDQFSILATPDSDSLWHLETGETYEITGLLGAEPVDTSQAIAHECPHCGDQLRAGQAIDAAGSAVVDAAEKLGIDCRFGILDETASVKTVDEDTGAVDDWLPMQDDQPVETPDFVCTSCGRHVAQHMLARDEEPVLENMEADASMGTMNHSMASPETVGLAAGGAKDVTNFRENVKNGYTPEPEAISDEGLFYDYYFETGERTATDSLFAPRYAAAVSDHPLTGETEQYLSVGLDSTLSVEEFERPRLDLVAVLDVSGSMSSAFDQYYYDEQGRQREAESGSETKLAAATQSLCALTEQLHAEDRLGVVLYNHRAHVAKPLRDVGATDMPAIRQHIRDIAAGGSTNMEDGFEAAVDMLADGTTSHDLERRVIFMTDMMPNTGQTGANELTELFADAAADGIHTTFIGMGLDANAELADTVSGIRGANHYFIHSADEFEQRLGEEFDYMVTPLVYNLDLELDATGYEVEAVHGSPSADDASEQLMHVGTLFPSAKQDGQARGGVILVRLTQTAADATLELQASWTERDGAEQTERVAVSMPEDGASFAHDGVRKAVALARYARELRAWARDVHDRADNATGVDDWLLPDQRGEHERESVPLVVPDEHTDRFGRLRSYLADEMAATGDEAMEQELELLDMLSRPEAVQEAELSE
ncbi:vWA domain-containing protein [Haloarcula onubensis]|uniref:VWA domain-containing protein n=1 Tax=Haloarcula onubensis TaxID=2950539 RepID=A0ABU2FTI5_9EURY|nr:VWA domain-containing protein [Halomicroarcula sp. S3CR25-11]MDS0284082.1 VWA domain-containing protein [Halomicroarcula sp. S3CR25-11]